MARPSAKDRENQSKQQLEKKDSPLAFSQEVEDVMPKTDTEVLVRKTYYLTPEIKDAIDYMAFAERKEKSQVVRELLLKAIDPKYFNRPE